jgi:hypothetical protein
MLIKQIKRMLMMYFLMFCSSGFAAAPLVLHNHPQIDEIYNASLAKQDVSLQMLGKLVGSVGDSIPGTTGQTMLMSELFAHLNLGIMIFAGSVIAFLTVFSVINSTYTGETMFKRLSGLTFPRIIGGIAILVPIKGGYSLAQIMVITTVVYGVELANKLWETALDFMTSNTSTYLATYNVSANLGSHSSAAQKQAAIMKLLVGTSASQSALGQSASSSFVANMWTSAACISAAELSIKSSLAAPDSGASSDAGHCVAEAYKRGGTVRFGQACKTNPSADSGGSVSSNVTADYPYICVGSGFNSSDCAQENMLPLANQDLSETNCGLYRIVLPNRVEEEYDVDTLNIIYQQIGENVKTFLSDLKVETDALTWMNGSTANGQGNLAASGNPYFCLTPQDKINQHIKEHTSVPAQLKMQQQAGLYPECAYWSIQHIFIPLDRYFQSAMALNYTYPSLVSYEAKLVGGRVAGEPLQTKIAEAKLAGWAAAGRWFKVLTGEKSEALLVSKNLITYPIKTNILNKQPVNNPTAIYAKTVLEQQDQYKSGFLHVVDAAFLNYFMVAISQGIDQMLNLPWIKQPIYGANPIYDRLTSYLLFYLTDPYQLTGVYQYKVLNHVNATIIGTEASTTDSGKTKIASNKSFGAAAMNGLFGASDMRVVSKNLSKLIDKVMTYITGMAFVSMNYTFTDSDGLAQQFAIDPDSCARTLLTKRSTSDGSSSPSDDKGGNGFTRAFLETMGMSKQSAEEYIGIELDTATTVCHTEYLKQHANKLTPRSGSSVDLGYNPLGCFELAMSNKCIPGTNFGHDSSEGQPFGFMGLAAAFMKNQQLPNPMLALMRMGQAFLEGASAYWFDTTVAIYNQGHKMMDRYIIIFSVSAVATTLSGSVPGLGMLVEAMSSFLMLVATALYKVDLFFLQYFASVGDVLVTPIYVSGLMLGVYLPFVPQLIFIFTVMGWMISIVEALVAAPLVAIGVTHPDGSDMLGKADQATMLLFGVFIRPAAVIIGFIIATELSYAAITLFNIGYGHMLSHYLTLMDYIIGFPIVQYMCISLMVLLYSYAVIAIWNQTLAITYIIPDQILKWIGGGGGDLSSTKQFMKQIHDSTKGAAGKSKAGSPQRTPSIGGLKSANVKGRKQAKEKSLKKKKERKAAKNK